jgi:hypothetical protein
MYTYDVVGFGRNKSNIRYRTKNTTLYVHAKTYDIVYDMHRDLRHRIRHTFSNLQCPRFSLTYDIVCLTYDVVCRIYDVDKRTMWYVQYILRTMLNTTS